MSSNTYYPPTVEGRAEFWENIGAAAPGLLPGLGFAAAAVTSITNDAAWGVYVYRTLRVTYEKYFSTVTAFAGTVASGIGGTTGQPVPPAPEPPEWPTAPVGIIECDFEARREDWVQAVKSAPGYTPSIGETLRIIAPSTPFDPNTYTAEISGLLSQAPKTITGRFRKARGNVDGILLFGRKDGSAEWKELGKFTATPFTAPVPVATTSPEIWQFQARAFKRDVPFGNPSDIVELTIKG
jgi:hypothetical protein